jgi:RHS repeat-associated protein
VRFTYDAFGRRVQKDVLPSIADLSVMFEAAPPRARTTHRTTVQFLWDGDVLCEEQDSSKEDRWRKRVHVHEPRSFVAFLQTEGGETLGVVNDHLGTPKELVDASGRIVWRAEHGAWGNAIEVTRSSKLGHVESPFRLLGHYADHETGLCFTRFRYFEPLTGRWLTPDPIGCAGGPNLQAFDGAPTTHTDPFGLACLGIHKNLKEHYISKQKLLEEVLGMKLPKWSSSDEGQLARQRLGEMIDSGELRYLGQATFKRDSDPVHVFEGKGGAMVTVWQNGQWNTALRPGEGMALNAQYVQPTLPGLPRSATPFSAPSSWGSASPPPASSAPGSSNQLPLFS